MVLRVVSLLFALIWTCFQLLNVTQGSDQGGIFGITLAYTVVQPASVIGKAIKGAVSTALSTDQTLAQSSFQGRGIQLGRIQDHADSNSEDIALR